MKRILPLALIDPLAFLREMGHASHSVGILFLCTKLQLMQETSALQSTLAVMLTTQRICSLGKSVTIGSPRRSGDGTENIRRLEGS